VSTKSFALCNAQSDKPADWRVTESLRQSGDALRQEKTGVRGDDVDQVTYRKTERRPEVCSGTRNLVLHHRR
jgi:hypothetical protein